MIRAIDGFSGAGGSTEGLVQAGVQVEVVANHWPLAVATHQLNHPNITHRTANLSETDWRTFPWTEAAWWSPSCRGHAPAGGRRCPPADVERRRDTTQSVDRATAFAVIACAEVHRQLVIIVENVPEFRTWSLYPWWLDGLRALDYEVRELVLDAVDFGHAQHRRRLFVVATQPGIELDLTLPVIEPVTAAAILDPNPGRPVTRRLYVADQIDEIPAELDGVPHLVTYRKHAHARRVDKHAIATVTAGGNHHGLATVIDGVPHHRLLTNRERARAQGFPDSYRFLGGADDVRRQIGNAVPVGIARWFGERVIAALDGRPSTPTTIAA